MWVKRLGSIPRESVFFPRILHRHGLKIVLDDTPARKNPPRKHGSPNFFTHLTSIAPALMARAGSCGNVRRTSSRGLT